MTYASAETLLLLMLLALGEFSDMTLMIVLLYYKHFFYIIFCFLHFIQPVLSLLVTVKHL